MREAEEQDAGASFQSRSYTLGDLDVSGTDEDEEGETQVDAARAAAALDKMRSFERSSSGKGLRSKAPARAPAPTHDSANPQSPTRVGPWPDFSASAASAQGIPKSAPHTEIADESAAVSSALDSETILSAPAQRTAVPVSWPVDANFETAGNTIKNPRFGSMRRSRSTVLLAGALTAAVTLGIGLWAMVPARNARVRPALETRVLRTQTSMQATAGKSRSPVLVAMLPAKPVEPVTPAETVPAAESAAPPLEQNTGSGGSPPSSSPLPSNTHRDRASSGSHATRSKRKMAPGKKHSRRAVVRSISSRARAKRAVASPQVAKATAPSRSSSDPDATLPISD
jgi:hypothetical protein